LKTEDLLSVGIDLGTTTTQVIFSRLKVENTASATSIPRLQIVGKEIIHRGGIHFTPLLSRSVIDTEAVRRLVESEYHKAGVEPGDLDAGAVIITGETARKENSEAVLRTLSGLAGDFVVATAGSDLESIIAGRGAGTDLLSRERPGRPLANMDIGGGTSNVAIFLDGRPEDTSSLDIGGRQIIVNRADLTLTYVAPKVAALAGRLGLRLVEGRPASLGDLASLCRRLAEIMAQALGLADGPEEDLKMLYTAHPLKSSWKLAGLTFSGGVADHIYGPEISGDIFPHGDIGVILGHAVRDCPAFAGTEILKPRETIRATVVGAGANTVEISGSTIAISDPAVLPLKNVPILKLTEEDEANDGLYFSSRLAEKIGWFREEDRYQNLAVSFRGPHSPSFEAIVRLRDRLLEGLDDYLRSNDLLVILADRDLAKSLGHSLINALPDKKIISLDTVKVENGDYIDIGLPLAGGRVVPVVVKTLFFGS
jgi:ethanolamine utilization protein EutA